MNCCVNHMHWSEDAVNAVTSEVEVASHSTRTERIHHEATEDYIVPTRLSIHLTHTKAFPRTEHSPAMPPKGSRKRAASEEYEADGGFVEDAPKSKKTKAASVKEAKPKPSPKSEDLESQYWEVGESRAS